MSEVSKVVGPSGAPNQTGKKDGSVDPEKFAEARRRISEVSSIDPDEQKKRKRQEEAEEEEILPLPEEPTPPTHVPPFLLIQEPKEVGLLGMKRSGLSSTPTTPPSETPYRSFFSEQPPPLSETEQTPPAPPTPPSPPSSPSDTQSQPPAFPEQTAQTSSNLENLQQPSKPPQTEAKKTQAAPLKEPLELEPNKEPAKDTTGFFKQLKAKQETLDLKEIKQPTVSEVLPEKGVEALIETGKDPVELPLTGSLTEPLSEKRKDALTSAEAILEGGSVTGAPPPLITPPESIAALSPYAKLSPQIQEIFDKMVGVVTVMTLSGMTETTFTLSASKFASSVFFGAQIIIREFSTAPQAFNIQLNGSMQAVNLFQANADDLMAAFQAGNYNFRINRLETNYLSEDRPLFKRKESDSQEQGQDKGKG